MIKINCFFLIKIFFLKKFFRTKKVNKIIIEKPNRNCGRIKNQITKDNNSENIKNLLLKEYVSFFFFKKI